MRYIVTFNGRTEGPYSQEEIKRLFPDIPEDAQLCPEDADQSLARNWRSLSYFPHLSRSTPPLPKAPPPKAPPRPQKRRLKILSTDDDPGIRALLWEVLGGEGHEMRFAKDGKEVFQRLQEAAFDLLILDVNMPEMDGYHVSSLIHQKFRTPPKTLIFTGRDIDKEKFQFFSSDADAILPKSAPVEEILGTIDSLFPETQPPPPEPPAFIPEPAPPGESLEIIHGAAYPDTAEADKNAAAPARQEKAPPRADKTPPIPPARLQQAPPESPKQFDELLEAVRRLQALGSLPARQETTITELALMKKTLAGISARLELNNKRLDHTRAAAVAALAAVLVFGLVFVLSLR